MSGAWLTGGLLLIAGSILLVWGQDNALVPCPFYEMRVAVGDDHHFQVLKAFLRTCQSVVHTDNLDVPIGKHYHFWADCKYWKSLKDYLDYGDVIYTEVVGENRTDPESGQNCTLGFYGSSAQKTTSLFSPILVLVIVIAAIIFTA